MKKISVIVPAYNIGEKIVNCLNSLHSQSLKDAEFLIVDDGSTDNTAKVIKNYVNKHIEDKRFKYLYKVNGGTSDARNYGIKKAGGEYIWFVDSDDLILDKKALFNIWNQMKAKDLEVLQFNFQKLDKRHKKNLIIKSNMTPKYKDCVMEGKDLLNLPFFDTSACFFSWKRNYLLNNDLFFNTVTRGGEDVLFTIPTVFKAKKTMYIDNVFYEYILNNESKTVNCKSKKEYLSDAFFALDKLNSWFNNQNSFSLHKSNLSNHIVKMFIGRVMEANINDYPLSRKYITSFLKGKKLDWKDHIKEIILLYFPKKLRKQISIRLFGV